ncbi:DNA polymerase III subunit beta [Patescibacteria group bacterium]|nr:MAG: DNA polymerase III subunit beta [Patescibacteria group bacterium]
MKVRITQENLARALQVTGRIVGSRTSLPVLANVLISTDSNRLKISATNLEIGITHWIGCKVEQEGSITVPAKLLGEFVANLPSGKNLDLETTDANLTITTPNYNSHMNGIAAEEFPATPEVSTKPILTLPSELLREAIAQVVVAAAPDESRPVLAGVYMYIDEGQLVLVSTDSFRLAEYKLPLPKQADTELQAIIPTRTMQELVRILGESEGDVAMYIADNQVMFQVDDTELVSRLIEGKFPDYQQIIPSNEETRATLATVDFTRITKMAHLFARENGGNIRIEVQAEGELRILSSAAQVGDNTSSSPCEVAGDDNEISLNASYLTDALTAIKTKKVSISMSGKLNATVIKPDGNDAPNYLHIIMPVRT